MATWRRLSIVLTGLALLGVAAFSPQTWAAEPDHIGIVLAVEGSAEVRTPSKPAWEALQFRDHIFIDETIRTHSNGKVKLLLRNDSIMTLSENSEIHITDFLLNDQQHRSLINLVVGKVRVLTTKLFGRSDAMEVKTPNSVAGVRSSEKHVAYDDLTNRTTVLCMSGHCYIRDHHDAKQHLRIPEGHVTEHAGLRFPSQTRQLSHQDRHLSAQHFALTTHDPRALTTDSEAPKAPKGPPRRSPQRREGENAPPPTREAEGDEGKEDSSRPRPRPRGDGPRDREQPPPGEGPPGEGPPPPGEGPPPPGEGPPPPPGEGPLPPPGAEPPPLGEGPLPPRLSNVVFGQILLPVLAPVISHWNAWEGFGLGHGDSKVGQGRWAVLDGLTSTAAIASAPPATTRPWGGRRYYYARYVTGATDVAYPAFDSDPTCTGQSVACPDGAEVHVIASLTLGTWNV